MFELAPLAATSNLEEAVTALQHGAVVVFLGDPLSKPVELNNALNGTELVPNYTLLQILINGDIVGFEKHYYSMLTANYSSFVNIFNLMYMKKTVFIYFPADTKELKYPELLLKFFRSYYGVQAATKSTEFLYDKGNYNLQVNLLIAGIISIEDFIMNTEYIDDKALSIIHTHWDDVFPEFRTMTGQAAVNFIDIKKKEIKDYGCLQYQKPIQPAFTQAFNYNGIILP